MTGLRRLLRAHLSFERLEDAPTCALREVPRSATAVALQALSLLVHQRLTVDVARYRPDCDLRVLPTLCPLNVTPTDFGQSARLLRKSDQATRAWLEDGTPDLTSRFGFAHRH